MNVESQVVDLTEVTGHPRRVTVYAYGLFALAVATIVALVALGQPLPSAGLCLVLAIPLTLCMNRFVAFTNEIGATAEAAVMFAALVLFRDDAVFLGPLFLAVLVGPLDARHWERRSFARMAFNSGSQVFNTLAAVVMFEALLGALGSTTGAVAVAVAVAVAAVPYVLAETLFGVVLAMLWGEHGRDALRQQLPINCVIFALAAYGAAAGGAGAAIGWWFTLGALIPVPLVPELVLVRAQRTRDLGATTLVAIGVVVLGAAVLFARVPVHDPFAFGGLLLCALLLGIEIRAVVSTPVPPVIGLLLAAAFAGASGTGVLLAVPAVAAVATGSAWWATGSTSRAWRGAAAAGCIAIAAAWAWRGFEGGQRADLELALAAAGTCAAFQLAAVVLSRQRRDELTRALWVAPLLVTAGALAVGAHAIGGLLGVLVFALGLGGALIGVAAAGAPPWRSRVLGPRLSRVPCRAVARVMVVVLVLTVGSLTAAAVDDSTGRWWSLTAVALGEMAVALSLIRARQWTFAPRALVGWVAVSAAVALGLVACAWWSLRLA